jgi:hypothetical protein
MRRFDAVLRRVRGLLSLKGGTAMTVAEWRTWAPALAQADVCLVPDFELRGDGSSNTWERALWLPLSPIPEPGQPAVASRSGRYDTMLKCLYSSTGLYLLFSCGDGWLSTSMTRDGDDLWKGDAVEVFLWPDESRPLYFQYDLSPLGPELVLLVPGHGGGGGIGWSPWRYEGPRRVRSMTRVNGGPRQPHAKVTDWSTEIFIPFALLDGVVERPTAGRTWRANFYRVDHDAGVPQHWAWCERTGKATHAIHKYGTLRFVD